MKHPKKLLAALLAGLLCAGTLLPAAAALEPGFQTSGIQPVPLEELLRVSREQQSKADFTLQDSALLSNQEAAQFMLEITGATSIQYALIEGARITDSNQVGVYSKTEATPLSAQNLYGIGSISKTYTAAAVMKLVEQKKISLDDPVTKYIPEFTMADPRYKDITIRMLLNHSSGLWGSSLKDALLFADDGNYATKDLLNRLKTQTLKADPGAYSVYCNDGFTLAELVIERVTGKTYTQYIHSALLGPMKLGSTFAPGDTFDDARLANTYYLDNLTPLPRDVLGTMGTGGLYSTAEDLARFGSLFYGNYGSSVINSASRDAMAAPEYLNSVAWPQDEDQSISYGLGWDNTELFPFERAGIQALSKGGDTLQYHASLVVLPQHNMAVAVLSSGGASTYNQLIASTILCNALKEKGTAVDLSIPPLPTATAATPTAADLSKAGLYGSTVANPFTLNIATDGTLTSDELLPDMSFQYQSDGSYRDAGNSLLLKPLTEKDGNVYLYEKTFVTIPGFVPLVASDYAAQQLPPRSVADFVWTVWMQSTQQYFFLTNERHTSQMYLMQGITALPVMPNDYGYAYGYAVMDESTLAPVVVTPGMSSRDYQIIKLVNQDGKLYLKINDQLYLAQSHISDLYPGKNVACTIQPNGHARWYTIGEDSAGEIMSVTTPETGYFYVYDAYGQVVASSLFGDSSAALPQGGYIVFAGEAADQFKITVGALRSPDAGLRGPSAAAS